MDLAVVMAAAPERAELLVGEMLDELAQSRIGAEEVLADVGAVGDGEALILAVERLVHLVDQDAVDVAREQVVPLAGPDDLDDVPAGAAEDRLELLDDLAVAAHGAVEPLQVAVHHENEVVQALARRDVERPERLRLVALAVAEEAPDPRARGVLHAAVGEVAIEARLVDGLERSEAHGYRREFPEIGHEPWVRIRRQALLERLAAEVVEISLAEPPFEEGPGVDAGAGVTLEEDLVARGAVVLAAEEVVEADLVQGRGRSVGGQVPADARVIVVGAHDHGHGVPAGHATDAELHGLVPRE